MGCRLLNSTASDEMFHNHSKKLDLTQRIRMHRSRASGGANLSRYGVCWLWHAPLYSALASIKVVVMEHTSLFDPGDLTEIILVKSLLDPKMFF